MIIGITGTLASGKSTVAKIIAVEKKGKVFDADKTAHELLDNDATIYQQVISVFGRQILDKKGKISRGRLADIVFSDREKLKSLCNILHPKVVDEIKASAQKIIQKYKNGVVVIDAPLLIEAGLDDFCDAIIVVASSVSNILSRVKEHKNLAKE